MDRVIETRVSTNGSTRRQHRALLILFMFIPVRPGALATIYINTPMVNLLATAPGDVSVIAFLPLVVVLISPGSDTKSDWLGVWATTPKTFSTASTTRD